MEIHAAALNRADLMQREGNYPPPAGCLEWMELEIAGVIVEMGDEAKAKSKSKSNWKIGDKVCALLGGGVYAEYAADIRFCCAMTNKGAITLKVC